MTETVQIKGDIILRRANQPSGSMDFRFVVRWLLEAKNVQPDLGTIRLPRARVDAPSNAYVSDQFRLRIYRKKRDADAKQYFDFAALDFVAAPTANTEKIVAPLLKAILRPKSQLRWVRDTANSDLKLADSTEAMWCATPDVTHRPFDKTLGAPANNLDSRRLTAAGTLTESLSAGDLLFDADDASARGEQYVLLRQRVAETIKTLTDAATGALEKNVDADGPDDGGRGASLLWSRFMADDAHRLALDLLATSNEGLLDPVVALEQIDRDHREILARVSEAQTTSDKMIASLADLAIKARALAPHSGDEGLSAIRAVLDAADGRASDRENLALSAVHGGRWFIYNYDQLLTGGTFPIEADWPVGQAAGAELVGLGYHSPLIPEARVRAWAAAGWRIGIELDAVPLPAPAVALETNGFRFESDPVHWTTEAAARIWTADDDRTYLPDDAIRILAPQLGLLAPPRNGTTTLPLAPCAAELMLDAVQLAPQLPADSRASESDDKTNVAAPSYPTGDAAVQLLFGLEDPNGRQGRGYNVYAVWQNGTQPPVAPDLAALPPWLVNTRYSFLTDIYHAAGIDAGAALSGIYANLLQSPPDSPVVPRPAFKSGDALERALLAGAPAEAGQLSLQPDDLPDLDIYHLSSGLKGRKTFHFDVRAGTAAPDATKDPSWQNYGAKLTTHSIRWDMRGLVARDLRARELPVRVPWRLGIDRYQLFVTVTDLFGQESDPVPVETHSAFMSGNGVPVANSVYRPVSRRPLLDPPTDEPSGQPATVRSIRYDQGARTLVVEFSTPFVNEVELGLDNQAPVFMSAGEVEAEVMLLRKFIMPEDQGPPELGDLAIRRTPQPLPFDLDSTWLEHVQLEGLSGFLPYRGAIVTSPSQANRWSLTLPVAVPDHGHEYKAAVRFRLKADARKHWFPDQPKRAFHKFDPPKQPGDDWEALVGETPEIITRGRIGVTGTASTLNRTFLPAPPFTVAGASGVSSATPIGAVPDADRDVVLMKLLTREVVDEQGAPQLPIPWPDAATNAFWTGWDGRRFKMSLAQKEMIESGLKRVPIGNAYSSKWRPFVELLAFDIGEQIIPNPPPVEVEIKREKRAPLIGLRGAFKLVWDYQPVPAGGMAGPGADRVDASEFRISVTRISRDPGVRSSTYVGTINLDSAKASFKPPKIKRSDGAPVTLPPLFAIANLINGQMFLVRKDDHGLCSILPDDEQRWAAQGGGSAAYEVHGPQHIWTIPVGQRDGGKQRHEYYFPVGGGYQETLTWIVESSSSAQIIAPELVSGAAEFSSSIMPPPITAFTVQPVVDPDASWLAPNQKGYYPSDFETGDTGRHLKSQPRLKLDWADKDSQPPDAGIVIHKEARSIWGAEISPLDDAAAILAAIQRIAALPAGAPIALADVILIRPWLEGKFNWAGKDEHLLAFWPPLPARPKKDPRFLDARGLAYGGSKPGKGFLDYFHDVLLPRPGQDRTIEYDHEYRYSIASYVDLGETLPGASRYLIAQATPYSDFVLPPLPGWRVDPLVTTFVDDPSLAAPQLRLTVELIDRRNLAKKGGARVGFSIEVARLLDGTLSTGPDNRHQAPIDRNLQLQLADQGGGGSMSGQIVFDRIGRSFPDHPSRLRLRISIGSYLAAEGDKRLLLEEQVKEVDVTVPARATGQAGEKLAQSHLKILVG